MDIKDTWILGFKGYLDIECAIEPYIHDFKSCACAYMHQCAIEPYIHDFTDVLPYTVRVPGESL